MVSARVAAAGISPLDRIRQAEAEANGRLAAARQLARSLEVEARAAAIIQQAHEAGRREGDKRRNEAVAAAEARASVILIQARSQAKRYSDSGRQRLASEAASAVRVVLGVEQADGL